MPNLTFTHIAATLATLAAVGTACSSKQAPSPTPTRATEVTTSAPTIAATAAPAPIAASAAAVEVKKADAKDASVKGPMGASSGQMSCGAGSCSGSGAAKKK